jgi:prephenate dehydrogenase
MIRRVTILGLGQTGGSITLALRKAFPKLHITGIDRESKLTRKMRPNLDANFRDWKQSGKSDLVIACLHYRELNSWLKRAPNDQLILDVCSGKAAIMRQAEQHKLRMLGGHPMAGNEFAGDRGWDVHLFRGAPFFLCPSSRIRHNELASVRRLIRGIGALPLLVDPKEHDRMVAMTSHFPAFLSDMLQRISRSSSPAYRGPGFRSMTRLAATPQALLRTFLQSNRANILRNATKLQRELDRWIKQNRRKD